MKKIGIITHYDVHNHGAVLQLYALVQVLREHGFIAHALKFEKDLRYIERSLRSKYNLSIKSIPVYIRYLFNNGMSRTIYNVRKRRILETFKQDNKLIEGKYGDEKCDLIIVGSDEVFSTEAGISFEFFNINEAYDNVITYAASFGKTTKDDIERKQERFIIEPGLKSFKGISVRDKNSQEILESFGIDSQIVCDPVILYGFGRELIGCEGKENYMLVYSYDNNMNGEEKERIIRYARANGLTIVSAGFYHKWCDKNVNCSPIELLKVFKKAKAVVTDTFHGSVMSLITNTEFVALIRNNSQKLRWLLHEYDLENRVSRGFSDLESIFKNKIDYRKVNDVIFKNRAKSMEWLYRAISNQISISAARKEKGE